MMFWSHLGFKNGFGVLKSRVGLSAKAGIGIVRGGVPIAYICLAYLLFEGKKNLERKKKNAELTMTCVVSGIVAGLILRRVLPLK